MKYHDVYLLVGRYCFQVCNEHYRVRFSGVFFFVCLFLFFVFLFSCISHCMKGVSVSSRIQTQYLSKEYLSVFMLNSGIYETEEVRIRASIYLSI